MLLIKQWIIFADVSVDYVRVTYIIFKWDDSIQYHKNIQLSYIAICESFVGVCLFLHDVCNVIIVSVFYLVVHLVNKAGMMSFSRLEEDEGITDSENSHGQIKGHGRLNTGWQDLCDTFDKFEGNAMILEGHSLSLTSVALVDPWLSLKLHTTKTYSKQYKSSYW